MKICVVTSVFNMIMNNCYAKPIDPKNPLPNVDYICFTDRPFKSKIWECRVVPLWNNDPIKSSKIYKILAYKYLSEYDASIWMDIHCVLNQNCIEPLKYLNEYSCVFFEHDQRNCIYDEAEYCIKIKKDIKENLEKVINRYKKKKFPEKFGLTENTVHWKSHRDNKLNEIMDLWWYELSNNSCIRDQCSLMYCFWKKNFKNYKLLNGETENTKHLETWSHKEKYYTRYGSKYSLRKI